VRTENMGNAGTAECLDITALLSACRPGNCYCWQDIVLAAGDSVLFSLQVNVSLFAVQQFKSAFYF